MCCVIVMALDDSITCNRSEASRFVSTVTSSEMALSTAKCCSASLMTFWNRTKSHTFGIARPFYSLWQNCGKHLINCLAAAPTASARYSLTTPYQRQLSDHFLSSPKSCSEHLVNATNCNSLLGRRLASCLMRHFHFVSPKRWIRLCLKVCFKSMGLEVFLDVDNLGQVSALWCKVQGRVM